MPLVRTFVTTFVATSAFARGRHPVGNVTRQRGRIDRPWSPTGLATRPAPNPQMVPEIRAAACTEQHLVGVQPLLVCQDECRAQTSLERKVEHAGAGGSGDEQCVRDQCYLLFHA